MNVDVSLVKIKTEADSNEITDIAGCSHDDKPSTGMFDVSDDIVSAVSCLCILCAVCCKLLSCCVYAGSSMEFQCFEIQIKTEADSNECPHDDKPSTGMFAVSEDIFSALSSSRGSVVS